MNALPALAAVLDALAIALVATAVVRTACAHARTLGRPGPIAVQQCLLAGGLVSALSFMSAAGVIRSIDIRSWDQFGMMTAIVALRSVLGRALHRSMRSPVRS